VATLVFTVALAADALNLMPAASASAQELQKVLKQKQEERDALPAKIALEELDSYNDIQQKRSRDVEDVKVAPSMHGCKEEVEEDSASEDEEKRFKRTMEDRGMCKEELDEEWKERQEAHPEVRCSKVVAKVAAKPKCAVAKPRCVRVGAPAPKPEPAPKPKGTVAKKAKAAPRPKGTVAQMPKTGTGQGLNIVFSMCADIL